MRAVLGIGFLAVIVTTALPASVGAAPILGAFSVDVDTCDPDDAAAGTCGFASYFRVENLTSFLPASSVFTDVSVDLGGGIFLRPAAGNGDTLEATCDLGLGPQPCVGQDSVFSEFAGSAILRFGLDGVLYSAPIISSADLSVFWTPEPGLMGFSSQRIEFSADNLTPVPEPSTVLLLGSSLLGLHLFRRSSRRRSGRA